MQSAHITQRRCALAPLCYGSLMLYSGIRCMAFVISLLLIWGQGLIPMATLLLERDLGARGYIGVDFAFAPTLHRQLGELPNYERTIPYAVVYDSIEEILPAIPEGSCSFICGGIDDFFPGFTRVVASLEEHLPTKLHPKGALLLASASYERYSFPGLRALSRPFSFTVFGRR